MNENVLAEFLDKAHISLGRYGHAKHEKGTSITTSFPDFDIWYTLTGSYRIIINHREYIAESGDAFLMTPGTTLVLNSLEYSEQLFCHFAAEYADRIVLEGDFADYKISAKQDNLLKSFVDNFTALSSNCMSGIISIKCILKMLLSDLLLSDQENLNTFLSHNSHSGLKQLSGVIKYINENMDKKLTNKSLASFVGFNQNYFSRYFKKHTGMSPKEYVLKVKMNYAKQLLVQDALPVQETSYRVGFSDPFAFSKKFKNLCGVSPSVFKHMNS